MAIIITLVGLVALIAFLTMYFKPIFIDKVADEQHALADIAKKHPTADLQKYKLPFFAVGLFFALLLTYQTFGLIFDELIPQSNTSKLDLAEETLEEPPNVFVPKPPPPPPSVIVLPEAVEAETPEEIDSVVIRDVEDTTLKVNDIVHTLDIDIDDEVVTEEIDLTIYDPSEVTVQAHFPGNLGRFVREHLKVPTRYRTHRDQLIQVAFVVEADGKLTQLKVLRGVSKNLDGLVVDVFEIMPDWIPAKRLDLPVRMSYIVPVRIPKK